MSAKSVKSIPLEILNQNAEPSLVSWPGSSIQEQNEESFDQISRMTAAIFSVPVVWISFQNGKSHWLKSKVGLKEAQDPFLNEICKQDIQNQSVFEIQDAKQDLRFARNPLISHDNGLRFLAGASLISNEQVQLGTLWIADRQVRDISASQKEVLSMLAKQVVTQIELKEMTQVLQQKNWDLTKTQEELKKTTQFFQQVIDSMPLGVYCKDVRGNFPVTMWNQLMAQRTGKSSSEIIGKTAHDLLPKSEADFAMQMDLKVLATGETVEVQDERIDDLCGRKVYRHSRKVPLKNEKGEIEQILVVVEDITARREAQALLIQSSKMSSLGEMAAGIAHEINNPLAIICGRSQVMKELIQSGKMNSTHALESIEKITETALRISKIISGLRAFAREGSRDPFQHTSIQEIVKNATELCSNGLKSRSIQFDVTGLSPKLSIECRSVQIIQVLLNLLNNSSDAVSKLTDKWIRLDIRELESAVEFSVTDSGTGIPLDVQERMMQPFFTTKEIGQGTGLGLSISKGIIESHKGQIWYDGSKPHTCFVVQLPKSQK